MRMLTTPRGARAVAMRNVPVRLVGWPFAETNAGFGRIVGEQIECRREPAELLHFFDLTGPILAPRRRFVTTIHDAAVAHRFEHARVAHKRLIQPWAARRAARAVAVSDFAREEAVRHYGSEPRAHRGDPSRAGTRARRRRDRRRRARSDTCSTSATSPPTRTCRCSSRRSTRPASPGRGCCSSALAASASTRSRRRSLGRGERTTSRSAGTSPTPSSKASTVARRPCFCPRSTRASASPPWRRCGGIAR